VRSPEPLWSELLPDQASQPPDAARQRLIGVLPGEGVGPEVVAASLAVLGALDHAAEVGVETRIGLHVELRGSGPHAADLSDAVVTFCTDVFAAGGILLTGPGGGRFVYDLRKRFDLYLKLNPLLPAPELDAVRRLKPEHVRGVDVLVVRENMGGVYQGEWSAGASAAGRYAEHSFRYTERQVRRVVEAAARIARSRRGHLAVVAKAGGAPSISTLWRDLAEEAAAKAGIESECIDVDLAAYLLAQDPRRFDVIVAPNLFGDVLSDLGGVLLGSRALSFGGSFGPNGVAVYQTNHGGAHDISGTDRANPVGQILALAMLLRQSLGLRREAAAVEAAVRSVWRDGWRTADIAEPGSRVVGTRQLGELIAQRLLEDAPWSERR
jgi:3-isopropylmalate dehydrogenase